MKTKRILAVVLAIMMIIGLSACNFGTVTAESLLEKWNTANTEKVSFNMDMNMSMNVSLLGETADLSTGLSMNVESTNEVAHIKGTTTTTQNGEKEESKIEVYAELDNDEYNIYRNEGNGWTVTKSDSSAIDVSGIGKLKDPVLRNKKEKYKDVDCYVVDGTLSLSEISNISGNNPLEDLGDIDVDVDAIYYFNAKTKDLYALEIEVGEAFSDIIQKAMMDDVGFSINMKITEFHIVISNIDLNFDSKIEIPNEVRSSVGSIDDENTGESSNNNSSKTDPDEYEEYDNVKWNSKFNELVINGKTFDITKITVKDLVEAGLEPDEDIDGFTVNPGRTESVYFDIGKWDYLSIGVSNILKKSSPLTDCPIYSVSLNLDAKRDDVSAAGISFHEDTEASLKEKFGQPSSILRTEYNVILSWEDNNYNDFSATINKETGKVNSINIYLNVSE